MTIMSPFDVELRTCGLPHVDIEFLKVKLNLFYPLKLMVIMLDSRPVAFHPMNQVGLMESDMQTQNIS